MTTPMFTGPEGPAIIDLDIQKCVICCTNNPEDFIVINSINTGSYSGYLNSKPLLEDFCASVLSLKGLKLDLSLCSKCYSQVEDVIKANINVDSKECRVRSLQLSVLQALRELQTGLADLEGKLKGIEDSVRNSESILEQESACGERNDAILLRSSVLNVTKELKTFKVDLGRRLLSNSGYMKENRNVKQELEHIELAEFPVEYEQFDDSLFNPFGGDWAVPHPTSTPPPKRKRKRKDNPSSKKSLTEENQESLKTKGRKTKVETLSKMKTLLAKNQNDSDSDYEEELKSKKRSKNTRPKSILKSDPDEDYDPGVDDDFQVDLHPEGADPTSDWIENLVNPNESKKRKAKSTKPKQPRTQFTTLPDPITKMNLKDCTPFRKHAIYSLLKQQIKIPADPPSEQPNSPEYLLRKLERDRALMYFDYNPELNTFHLQGFEVKINETDKSFDCSECPYQFKLNWNSKLKRIQTKSKEKIKKHIFLRHMNNMQCPICTSTFPSHPPQHYNFISYRLHLRGHMNDHPFTCEVCGRPSLNGGLVMKKHLWTHKSEEERREAELNGEVNPLKTPSQTELRFKCDTCDKAYPAQSKLLQHMQTHLDPSERTGLIPCERCGKSIRKFYMKNHQKFYCPNGEIIRETCPYSSCEGRTFKNKKTLESHLKNEHSRNALERPFICDICGKRFKSKSHLNNHKQTHREDKPFQCEQCGKGFALKKNLKRHVCRKTDIFDPLLRS